MANDHYAVCKEAKEYAYLGEFYCWDATFEVDAQDEQFLASQLGFAIQLLRLMRRNRGKLVEVMHENDFANLRDEANETILAWAEIRDGKPVPEEER